VRFGRPWFLATVIAMLPLSLWMFFSWRIHPNFIQEFFLQEALERLNYSSTFLPKHIRPPSWYCDQLWAWMGLNGYVGFCAGLVVVTLSCRSRTFALWAWPRKSTVFFSLFTLSYFLILLIAAHKRDAYFLPLIPFIAIIIAGCVKLLHAHFTSTTTRLGIHLFLAAMLLTGMAQTVLQYQKVPNYSPAEKALSKTLAPQIKPTTEIYTDDPSAALIVHFYLRRPIHVIAAPDQITTSDSLWFSRKEMPYAHSSTHYYYKIMP
jgi:4-amino-4-deoxy-L-arabinose transferase-like glycosyltransferase